MVRELPHLSVKSMELSLRPNAWYHRQRTPWTRACRKGHDPQTELGGFRTEKALQRWHLLQLDSAKLRRAPLVSETQRRLRPGVDKTSQQDRGTDISIHILRTICYDPISEIH